MTRASLPGWRKGCAGSAALGRRSGIFWKLLIEKGIRFSLKLSYDGDELIEAELDGGKKLHTNKHATAGWLRNEGSAGVLMRNNQYMGTDFGENRGGYYAQKDKKMNYFLLFLIFNLIIYHSSYIIKYK